MGKWRDFFKALATNEDVMDDTYVQEELRQFMAENEDSVKRVSDFERRLQESAMAKEKVKKPVVTKVPTATSNRGKAKKADKEKEEEKER